MTSSTVSLNQKESTEHNLSSTINLLKLVSSDVLPPATLHFLNLPTKLHQLMAKYLTTRVYVGEHAHLNHHIPLPGLQILWELMKKMHLVQLQE